MKIIKPINVPIITTGKREKSRNNSTFYTNILHNIREGKTDYVFTYKQVNELKLRLADNEELFYKEEEDGYILVQLIEKEVE